MPKNQTMPGNQDRSEKFHDPAPPKQEQPGGEIQEHGGGEGLNSEEGQYTGGGRTPGLQKK